MAAHQLFGNTECTTVFKNTVDTATTHGDRIKARKSQQDPKYQTVLQIFKRTHNTNHCSSGVHYTSFGTEQRPLVLDLLFRVAAHAGRHQGICSTRRHAVARAWLGQWGVGAATCASRHTAAVWVGYRVGQ